MSMTDLYKVFDQTVREITREVNRSILKVPEIEQKTLDATSNEPWGPHGQLMNEIARATRNFHEYQMIMAILWKRLQDRGENWRHVYKSLVVMEFLVANGSERVLDELRENMYQIQSLFEFQYTEPNGKDQGINVRKKAQTLAALLKDREAIRQAREKAAANRNKYSGMSSSAFRSGGSGNSGGYGGDFDSYSGGTRSRDRDDFDSYRSREGGAGRRGGGFDDEGYGRRDREGGRRDRYDDDRRPSGGRGGRDWDDDDGYSKEGYSKAGATTLPDDDDFDVRGTGKTSGGGTALGADDDFDDFDPRSSGKPAAPAKPPAVKPVAAAAPAPVPTPAPAQPVTNLLDDLLGPDPVAPTPAAASVDPFAALSAPTPAAPAAAMVDPFGAPMSAPAPAASNGFSAFAAAPAPATVAASDDFGDDDFGGFAAAPPAASASTAATAALKDPFAAASVDPFASLTSAGSSTKSASGNVGKFASTGASTGVKSGSLWDDALSRGIVDLKIGTGKEELASIGIMADSLGTPGSLNPGSNVPFHMQGGGMGRAMGSGSGKGITSTGGLASPTLMPMGSPGMGMPSAMGSMGAFHPVGGVTPASGVAGIQAGGMGFGTAPGMGMNAFPTGGMPMGGMGLNQQQRGSAGMGTFQF